MVVLVPTEEEIAPFRRRLEADCRKDIRIEICGVGMAAVVEAAVRILYEKKGDGWLGRLKRRGNRTPNLIILAGIAGAYTGSSVEIGDCVLVSEERLADAGAFREATFKVFIQPVYISPWVHYFPSFPAAKSNTVSVCAAPFLRTREGRALSGAAIENMEGAAFFAAVAGSGVPFLELRAISNRVGDPREKWNIPLATDRLAAQLEALTDAATTAKANMKRHRDDD